MFITDNNYTTVEKNKLSGIDDNANNYVHPATHPASMITESATRRFVSDTEKSTWDGKETTTGSQSKADTAEANAKAYTDIHDGDTIKHITSNEELIGMMLILKNMSIVIKL